LFKNLGKKALPELAVTFIVAIKLLFCISSFTMMEEELKPFKDETQTALFKDPVRTAL